LCSASREGALVPDLLLDALGMLTAKRRTAETAMGAEPTRVLDVRGWL
jgi:hypothetical protein